MTLPLMPAPVGSRSGPRFAGAIVVLLSLLVASPVVAEDADPFSATVSVDATADNPIKAREAARIDGQRRALAAIAERLAGGSTPTKLPKLDDKAITDLVASFEVANERTSAVRYLADYTFHFRPPETRHVLANAGIAAAAEDGAKTAVLLPVYQTGSEARLWEDPNPWRQAWDDRPSGAGAARLAVPLGDAGDLAAIDASKARAGDAAALAAIADRNGGGDTVVALAELRGAADKPGGVDVTVRRYRGGKLLDSHAEPVSANPGEAEAALLRRAVAAVVGDMESGWKKPAVQHYDQQGTLTAVLPITDLDDWVHARERLGTVSAIRSVNLVALSRQEATIEIGYLGNIDQLKTALAGSSFELVRGDQAWRLARTGSARAP